MSELTTVGVAPIEVTVVIPVKNDADGLRKCLVALDGQFRHVVVVDSNSVDNTSDIANEYGAKVVNFEWNGKFPKKRNWILRNYTFPTQWVLFLDSDEFVTREFLDEIRNRLPHAAEVGFWLNFNNWFEGKPLKYGDRFRKLALFRIGSGEYEQFPEDNWSHLDMEVHEHPILTGVIGEITAPIDHYGFRGLDHHKKKHLEYARWEKHRFEWLANASSSEWKELTKRQQFKYRYMDRFWFSWFYFFVSYFIKLGFLDGFKGLRFTWLKKQYFDLIRRMIHQHKSSQ